MASKTTASHFAFFLSFNLLFSTLFTATCASLSLPKFQTPPLPNIGWNPNHILPPLAPTSPSTMDEKCPRDAIKIGICSKLLNGDLLDVIFGQPPVTQCCSLVQGLVDFQASICLCTAIKASVLGIDLNKIPIALNLLVNNCGGKIPLGFQCP